MPSSSSTKGVPKSVAPTFAQYAAEDFVQGAGVAIFHLASERVVVCSAVDRRVGTYFFLPKGRRDAGEETRAGAEREGFEEVCIHLPYLHHVHVNSHAYMLELPADGLLHIVRLPQQGAPASNGASPTAGAPAHWSAAHDG